MGEPSVTPESWEAIEDLYRAGQLSICEIARQYGLSDTAIRKRAKANGWERDLSAKVRTAVRAELVRGEVRGSNAPEPEVINAAAAVGVEVVRSHRKDLSRLRRLADTLAGRVESYLHLTALPTDERDRPEVQAQFTALGAFLGPKETPGDLLDKLSKTLHRVIPLERQAFNLDDPAQFNPAGLVSPEQARRMAREVLDDGDGPALPDGVRA